MKQGKLENKIISPAISAATKSAAARIRLFTAASGSAGARQDKPVQQSKHESSLAQFRNEKRTIFVHIAFSYAH